MTYDETVAKMEAIDRCHEILTEQHNDLMEEQVKIRASMFGGWLSPRYHEISGADKAMRALGRRLLAEHSMLYEEIMSNSVRP